MTFSSLSVWAFHYYLVIRFGFFIIYSLLTWYDSWQGYFYIVVSLVCSCNLESAQMICTMWWWGYSSIRVSHAGRRSACWVRSDGTDWKTQLPPHIQPLLSYFTLTFWNRLTPSGNTPRNLVFGRSAEQNTKCGWQKVAEVVKGSSHVNVYC